VDDKIPVAVLHMDRVLHTSLYYVSEGLSREEFCTPRTVATAVFSTREQSSARNADNPKTRRAQLQRNINHPSTKNRRK
jgi:hypothetical protein